MACADRFRAAPIKTEDRPAARNSSSRWSSSTVQNLLYLLIMVTAVNLPCAWLGLFKHISRLMPSLIQPRGGRLRSFAVCIISRSALYCQNSHTPLDIDSFYERLKAKKAEIEHRLKILNQPSNDVGPTKSREP